MVPSLPEGTLSLLASTMQLHCYEIISAKPYCKTVDFEIQFQPRCLSGLQAQWHIPTTSLNWSYLPCNAVSANSTGYTAHELVLTRKS